MTFTVIIPARYASTRLPGKPLADLAGKPMVVRVAERAARAGAARVVVATDGTAGSRKPSRRTGIAVCLTGAAHATGQDRLAEAAQLLGLPDDAIVVNVQGDEPLLAPALSARWPTCSPRIRMPRSPRPAIRSPIPPRRSTRTWSRRCWTGTATRSISAGDAYPLGARRVRRGAGRRARRPAALPSLRALRVPRRVPAGAFPALAPAPIERFKALEQLRALWHGIGSSSK